MSATPQIDYTSRDFASIRADMLNRAAVVLPEWRSQDPSDFTTVLVELFAHAADVLHYYVDRAANEAFPQTAVLRSSMLNLASMLDYTPVGQAAATATVTFTRAVGVTGDVVIPAGTRLMTVPASVAELPVYFETDTEATLLSANSTVDVAVTEGTTITLEQLGVSDGGPFQTKPLYQPDVITDSWEVFVYEGSGGAAVPWQHVERLIDADATSNAFTTFVDEFGTTSIIFGDGVNGRIPPINVAIACTYRYGQGTKGNVGPAAISQMATSLSGIGAVSNAAAASGGVDRESIESLRSSIPLSLRSQDRAVTLTDYAATALHVAGVTKANAYWTGVAPATTIAVASNGASLPQATINVASTVGFKKSGTISVVTGAGTQTVTYTGITGTQFTGCSGGTGAMSTGGAVTQGTVITPVVNVYIAPSTASAPSGGLITTVDTYVQERSVIGKTVVTLGATYVPINITCSITVNSNYVQQWVKTDVSAALTALFDFASVTFADRISLGDAFRAITSVAGIDNVTLTVLSTTGSGLADVQLLYNQIPTAGTITVNASGGIVGP